MAKPVRIMVNGQHREAHSRPGLTLLRFLRGELGLTGTRQGCESGNCGACTVLLDGVAVQSCQLTLAAAEGAEVQTIEALRATPDGGEVAKALTRTRAAQCGYCLPGIVASAVASLRADGAQADLRAALERNICRCGTQHRILSALEAARRDAGAVDE
jgi:aerobic-type carbon monoxide dehydrogenase small subunit (CoxS/CutS family)